MTSSRPLLQSISKQSRPSWASALQVERAESATAEMQKVRDEAAKSISDSMLQQDAAMKQAQEAREASQQAHHQLQKAQHAQVAAEQQR